MPEQVHLVGVNGAGVFAAAACALAGTAVTSAAVDTQGFRFATITNIRDVNLLPGAVKYGDVPALVALCAPAKMAVAGDTAESAALATTAYKAASGSLQFINADATDMVNFLMPK